MAGAMKAARYAARWTTAVLLALTVAACAGREASLPRLAPDAVVVAFGDSLTYGTGAGPGESYPAQLETLIGRKVVNAGVPGELSSEGERRLPEVLDAYHPALLLLCHGGNDLLRRLGSREAETHVEAMARLARSRGISVVLLAVPRPGLLLKPAPFYRDVAQRLDIPIQQTIVSEVLSDRTLKSDTVHPNAAGYRHIAESLAALLRRAGAVE
jgi:acyl-CoA thioesterase-1